MGGQVGMGGMGPQMGQQQGLTPWGQMSSSMGAPGGPGGNPGYQHPMQWLTQPQNGAGQQPGVQNQMYMLPPGQSPFQVMGNALTRFNQGYGAPGVAGGTAQGALQALGQGIAGGAPQQPQGMISSGAFYRHLNQPPGQRGVISGQQPQQLAQIAGQALSGYQNMGGMGEPLSNAMARFNQGQAGGQQGQMGMLSGMTGGCPPWMPGCQGGGGGYGGGFAGSTPFFGGSRQGLTGQQPAQQAPPPPPSGGTSMGYSDAKLKRDIEPLEDGLELVNKLDPVRFNWIGSDAQTTGMIAQQVEEVLPGAVVDMGDGYKGIDGLAVIGALVGAIKTLTTRLEALEAS